MNSLQKRTLALLLTIGICIGILVEVFLVVIYKYINVFGRQDLQSTLVPLAILGFTVIGSVVALALIGFVARHNLRFFDDSGFKGEILGTTVVTSRPSLPYRWELILLISTPMEDREELIGDFSASFERCRASYGVLIARLVYRWDVICSVAPILYYRVRKFVIGAILLRHFF